MDFLGGDRKSPGPPKRSNLRACQEGLSFRQGALKASNGGLRASQWALGPARWVRGPARRGVRASQGWTDVQTDGQTELLPILKDFVPY